MIIIISLFVCILGLFVWIYISYKKNLQEVKKSRSGKAFDHFGSPIDLGRALENEARIKKFRKENEARIRKELAEEKKEQQARRYQKKKREKEILNKFGNEVGNKIINRKVWQGMTKEMLIESQGKPHDIKESVYKEKTNHKFYFGPRTTRQNTIVYAFEVSLENDKVVGWRDLE